VTKETGTGPTEGSSSSSAEALRERLLKQRRPPIEIEIPALGVVCLRRPTFGRAWRSCAERSLRLMTRVEVLTSSSQSIRLFSYGRSVFPG
jgi:hypothetical protein